MPIFVTKSCLIKNSSYLAYVISMYVLIYAMLFDWSMLIYFGLGLMLASLFVMDNVRKIIKDE